jgi:hypothetical protein
MHGPNRWIRDSEFSHFIGLAQQWLEAVGISATGLVGEVVRLY